MQYVVTAALGAAAESMLRVSRPWFERYAQRCGAQFTVLTEVPESVRACWTEGSPAPHYVKLGIHPLLAAGHTVLFLDADIVVHPDCPSLFTQGIPPGLCACNVQPFTPRHTEDMQAKCAVAGVQWDGIYFNSGVMYLSPEAAPLFSLKRDQPASPYGEQTFLNVKRVLHGIPYTDLGWQYNYGEFRSPERDKQAHIVHLLGGVPAERKIAAMQDQLKAWGISS